LKCQVMRIAKRRASAPGAYLFSFISEALVSLEYAVLEAQGWGFSKRPNRRIFFENMILFTYNMKIFTS